MVGKGEPVINNTKPDAQLKHRRLVGCSTVVRNAGKAALICSILVALCLVHVWYNWYNLINTQLSPPEESKTAPLTVPICDLDQPSMT